MSRLFVDTNVLYLILRPPPEGELRGWLRAQLDRFASVSTTLVVSPLILDELIYRLILASIADEPGVKRPLEVLRSDKVAALTRHGAHAASLVRERVLTLPGLMVAPVLETDLKRCLELLEELHLLPRDALHLAVAERKRCKQLVSTDPDFARASSIVRWEGPPGQVAVAER